MSAESIEDTVRVPPEERLALARDEVRRIGPYLLVAPLGAGGMGEVWLAEQLEPVHRKVALKIIKAGMDTKEVVARFESERQALALMDHPNIAKVFDGGSTPEGRPYFVMEHIDGVPITEHCDCHQLSTADRLELFAEVCDGVQHAHQKTVIHRDLKPSNILVTEVDGRPVPKIIDFGIAKATGRRLTEKTLFTEIGAMVGTPEYMSPEQADASGQDVDTRTDVYSLGVVLYQLLTGELPFASEKLRSLGYEELVRTLREVEPVRPSSRLSTLGDRAREVARSRGTEPGLLLRQLEGDLDAITLKALEKDRERRYGTASELAADLGRLLAHEPVRARAPSRAYRLRKYVRRHRVGVVIGVAAAVLLVGFSGSMAAQARRITRERDRANVERDRANLEREKATRTAQFMTRMFEVSNPSESRGNTVTAREILDKASKELETGLASQPDLRANMIDVIGEVYWKLGLNSEARALVSRGLELARSSLGPDHIETLRTANLLAAILARGGRLEEAESLFRATYEGQVRTLGTDHEQTLKSLVNLGVIAAELGRDAEAERLTREAVAIMVRVRGPENLDTLAAKGNVADTMNRQGDPARMLEAERLQREVLEVVTRRFGEQHELTLITSLNLATSLSIAGGRGPEVEELVRRAIAIGRKIMGPEHMLTLVAEGSLSDTLREMGQLAEAETLGRRVLATQQRVQGHSHPDTLVSLTSLARTLTTAGKLPEAETLARSAFDAQRTALGPNSRATLDAAEVLVAALVARKKLAEAEILGRSALDAARAVLNPRHATTTGLRLSLASAAVQSGRRDEALSLLQETVDQGMRPEHRRALATDAVWAPLRSDPWFAGLVADAQSPVTRQ
jgi:serine/threonine protein kinase